MQLSGTDLVTTAPAATITLFPIVISPSIDAPQHTMTLSPIMGVPCGITESPIVTR